MAKKRYSKKRSSKKIEPAVLTFKFSLYTATAAGNPTPISYIDLAQVASAANRRFYRQGRNWAVAGFEVLSDSDTGVGSVFISTLPNTWVTGCAWEKTYHAWKKQQDDAIADAGGQSAVARYRDFKIHMDNNHVTLGFAANAVALQATPMTGEWQATQVVIPNTAGVVGDTDEFSLHMVGADSPTSFSMISNYGTSRAYPQSPDPVHAIVQDSFFSEMFNVGMDDSEIVANATNTNDELPYDQDSYPGGAVVSPFPERHRSVFVTPTTIGARTFVDGCNVPCGLLRIDNTLNGTESTSGFDIVVKLVSGHHRGYLSSPMEDF